MECLLILFRIAGGSVAVEMVDSAAWAIVIVDEHGDVKYIDDFVVVVAVVVAAKLMIQNQWETV